MTTPREQRFAAALGRHGLDIVHGPFATKRYNDAMVLEEQQRHVLQFSLWRLEALREWERDCIFAELKLLAEALDIKLKDFLAPLFLAVIGTTASFSVMDAMTLLGPDMTRARIRHALHRVCGEPGKKQLKKLARTGKDQPDAKT